MYMMIGVGEVWMVCVLMLEVGGGCNDDFNVLVFVEVNLGVKGLFGIDSL